MLAHTKQVLSSSVDGSWKTLSIPQLYLLTDKKKVIDALDSFVLLTCAAE